MNLLPHEFVLRDLTWYICLASSEWVPIECWKTPGRHLDNSWMPLEWFLNVFWMSSEWVLKLFQMHSEWEFWMKPEWLLTKFCTNSECVLSESWITLNAFWISSGVLNEFWLTPAWPMRDFFSEFWTSSAKLLLGDFWMTPAWLMNTFWMSSEGAQGELCATPGWLLNDLWMSPVHVLKEFWVTPECLLNQFWRSSEWDQNDSQWVQNEYWMISE